ncbi:TetR/AcrR family transcriptional regulator [Acinetobacter oleivorans]|uniref:TetR/AcrR family transcriptional regulator n=1 Tax=Acinetobacter oleivorans TaxID=1148157 RepID=UPI003A864163
MTKHNDESMRQRLINAAARVLAEDGVKALTTRKIVAETGTSTMSVYTHFGSLENLVKEMIVFGFKQLDHAFDAIPQSLDSVSYLVGLTYAYIQFAREHSHLYAVMFGSIPLGDLRVMEKSALEEGLYTLEKIAETVQLAIEQKRFHRDSAFLIANQWWTIVHGFALLESARYLVPPNNIQKVLKPLLLNYFIGLGDQQELASASLLEYF